jgi:acetylornithine deacetylase/succinyl-diaminopimelate desuccinylase-like protein
VIPGELKARFNLRWSPVQTLDGLKKTVTDILDRHGVRYSLEWFVSGEPFYTPPGPLSDARSRRCATSPAASRSCRPAAAPRTVASSRRWARRWWNSAS